MGYPQWLRPFLATLSSWVLLLCFASCSRAGEPKSLGSSLELPKPGTAELKVLTPQLLELTLITTKKPYPAPLKEWSFVEESGSLRLPNTNELVVLAEGQTNHITAVGFRRRVLYAPFKQRDLRIANYLYLQLSEPIKEHAAVQVSNPDHRLWPQSTRFETTLDPQRLSPMLHVNQTGYGTALPKKAMLGYFLGSLGEFGAEGTQKTGFEIVDTTSGKSIFQGKWAPRPDRGFPDGSYQKVLEGDFSSVRKPGEYRVRAAGLGVSAPFVIDDNIMGAFARTYALGVYHQRCGTSNSLPFTRFTHGPCHLAPAEVPTLDKKFESVNESLAKESANFKENPRHTARQLKSVADSLYPFANKGPVDVHGGHHDAGDYSKYTCNSAMFIHGLLFGVDNFPGVADLDNLGIPESGDSKSDLLQEVKWEADFLARTQDADGGFYFLVYPRDREYEIDVLPDKGDPQIVFPKTTAVTAAGVAALAACSSSPAMKKQFPEAAAMYLEKAKKGWAFLERAFAKYGKDGAYQKITHYGDDYMHDDEFAWAACELFLATGEKKYHQQVIATLHPADPDNRKWGWWRLYDAYGCAIRSYGFGARSRRVKKEQLQPLLLDQCESEIQSAGEDQLRRANESAYGTSFPRETKQARTAGWYFSGDAAFDLAVAYQLDYPEMKDPRPKFLEAIISNLNYEEGCNPVDVCYLTGLGTHRQREIVHQYAQNDRRVLPLTGIPLGNIQGGFSWIEIYKNELSELSFPTDGDGTLTYPFYDRWGDAFNLTQEFVITIQARSLAYLSWLMARSSVKDQKWKPVSGTITSVTTNSSTRFQLTAAGIDFSKARTVWEMDGGEPFPGRELTTPKGAKPTWLEAEAQLPDGRRVFGVLEKGN
jgi:hypothetical protein